MSEIAGAALVGLVRTASVAARTGAIAALRRPWARWRASVAVAKQGRRHGVEVTSRGLYKWLGRDDVKEVVRTGSSTAIPSALSSLEKLLPESLDDRQSCAHRLMHEVLVDLIKRVAPSEAAAISSSRVVTVVQAESAEVKKAVLQSQNEVVEAINSPHQFAEDILSFNVIRRRYLEDASDVWPPFRSMIRALATTEDRGPALQQWSIEQPTDLQTAPFPVWLALATLSTDYGEQEASFVFLGEALERGAIPREYWLARAAVASEDRDGFLNAGGEKHLLGAALRVLGSEGPSKALVCLSRWEPNSPEDVAIKVMVTAQLQAGTHDLNAAIASLCSYTGTSSSVPLMAARYLLARARHGESALPAADALNALSLALKSRDLRRSWKGQSAEAAHVAAQAAMLSNDHARAWRIVRPAPEGEATAWEAGSTQVRQEALLMAVNRRDLEAVRQIASSTDPYEVALRDVAEASELGDQLVEQESMARAYATASSDAQRISVAFMVAYAGGSIPDLSELGEAYSGAVSEVHSLSQAITDTGDNLAILRARAASSRSLTALLAEKLVERGELHQAADVLHAGGERWRDPLLMKMAADRFGVAGEHHSAQSAAEAAIEFGGSGWAGEYDARVILLRAHEAQGDADAVTKQARLLVVIAPQSSDARWALISCQLRAGDSTGAWSTLTPDGTPILPRDSGEARNWIGLLSKFDHSPLYYSRALEALRNWSTDETVSGVVIANLILRSSQSEVDFTLEDARALQDAIGQYVERFPKSTVFHSIDIDPNAPLDALSDILKGSAEAAQEILMLVRSGRVPLGTLSSGAGRSYAQVLIQRAGGRVRAHRFGVEKPCDLNEVEARVAVLDNSAAFTLTLLDPSISELLLGQFSAVESTDAAYRDALDACETLDRRSTLSVAWDVSANAARPAQVSEELADEWARRAQMVSDTIRRARRHHWAVPKHIPLSVEHAAWLSTGDTAIDRGAVFWCDDVPYRSLVESFGCSTVGTIELIRHLGEIGVISTDRREVAEAVLIANYYVELGFSEAAMSQAADLDGLAPRGAALNLSVPSAWADPEKTMKFLGRTLDRIAADHPEWLRDWISAAAMGLIQTAQDSSGAHKNLVILIARLTSRPWINPSTLPWVISGVRAGLADFEDVEDPVSQSVQLWLGNLATTYGHAYSAQLLMALFAQTDEGDRALVTRAVLLAPMSPTRI